MVRSSERARKTNRHGVGEPCCQLTCHAADKVNTSNSHHTLAQKRMHGIRGKILSGGLGGGGAVTLVTHTLSQSHTPALTTYACTRSNTTFSKFSSDVARIYICNLQLQCNKRKQYACSVRVIVYAYASELSLSGDHFSLARNIYLWMR